MRTLALLLLCLPAYAAPLPPFPTVTRPAPLLSPKAASAPKATPMIKQEVFKPAGQDVFGWAPCFVTFTTDQFFLDSLVDITHVQAIQRANKGLLFQYKDSFPSTGWAFMAEWTPYPIEQVATVEWYHSTDQRRAVRVFRVVEYDARTGMRPAGAGTSRVNPELKGLRTWRVPSNAKVKK